MPGARSPAFLLPPSVRRRGMVLSGGTGDGVGLRGFPCQAAGLGPGWDHRVVVGGHGRGARRQGGPSLVGKTGHGAGGDTMQPLVPDLKRALRNRGVANQSARKGGVVRLKLISEVDCS